MEQYRMKLWARNHLLEPRAGVSSQPKPPPAMMLQSQPKLLPPTMLPLLPEPAQASPHHNAPRVLQLSPALSPPPPLLCLGRGHTANPPDTPRSFGSFLLGYLEFMFELHSSISLPSPQILWDEVGSEVPLLAWMLLLLPETPGQRQELQLGLQHVLEQSSSQVTERDGQPWAL